MLNRRKFIQLTGLTSAFISTSSFAGRKALVKGPIVLSTWAPNVKANKAAWDILSKGGRALDAVEAGVMIPEADPTDTSVGYGGLPDRDGRVTVDACVMNEKGQCGSVMGLEDILHPVQVARLVMEQTPHVQFVGEGALQFALSKGFKRTNLLTPQAEKAWKEWLKTSKYDPMRTIKDLEEKIQREKNNDGAMLYKWPSELLNHDTIGMIALDADGNLSGACSTSGMAFKMRGRVGDSPIIGAGLFVDNEVGAATCTGIGEEIVKICGAHTIVEMMRHGANPEEACKEAVRRIVKNNGDNAKNVQGGFIAINKKGEYGGYSVMKNFTMALHTTDTEKAMDVKSWF
ncbi:MAG: N(4)-(beta-N-acetylglucosaminyl)-L-asparaginase [Chitinophagaceae bacterium]|nr:N(4)-(beta-N-acetylglucosaminyl)-L-asparaginase [Chitinophagaceae bacterium]